jgi:tryptophan synthase beta chain
VFRRELDYYLRDYVGRPTPLYLAERLSEEIGVRIYLKREDLCHTGAHKINNSLGPGAARAAHGQEARHRRDRRGPARRRDGHGRGDVRHGMRDLHGPVDMERQALNVFAHARLGAEVVAVTAGQQTLKEAISEAMRDWVTNVRTTHYILGSALGAHPYPMMVRDFQSVIGREARRQILKKEKRLPTHLVACVGGGSNAIGTVPSVPSRPYVALIGVEAGGEAIRGPARRAVCRRAKSASSRARDVRAAGRNGQIQLTHSVSAGLDYAAVGPRAQPAP